MRSDGSRSLSLLQVLVLALNPSFGWSADLISWLDGLSLTNLLLPNRDPGEFVVYVALCVRSHPSWNACTVPALFNVVFGVMVLVVTFALADAACT